jgi:gliding motility-associated-like protein
MPTSAGAFAPTNNVGWDIGVFKIDFQVAGVNAAGAGTQNQGCAPITINFVNNSTGNQFLWDFGDGSPTDTAAVPSHTYTVPGTFTVSLIAMDSLSCNLADTITFPITIGQAQPITAAFNATPDPTCASFGVSTVNNSTGAPLAFEWDMGDGSPALTDTNVVHNYAAPGTYTISLITYDPTGCSQPDTTQQTVIIPPPITIDAGFLSQQVPDCDDIIVTTTDTTLNGTPAYQWDMGDGSPVQTSQNVIYTYTNQGTYTITLIVVDSSTCNISDTATANITVAPPDSINAAFTIDQQFDCSQLIVATDNMSTGDNLLYSWNMGDGTTLTDTNVVHTYTNPGTYTVSLTLSDALGCYPPQIVDTQITLDALAPVVADMNVAQVSNCNLLQVQGTNLSTGDSVSYTWTMGDGTILSTTDITHQYGNAGAYTIQLLVTDLTGCNPPDSIDATVTMVDQLPVVINSAQVICPGETITLDGTWNGATSYTWNNGATTPTIDITQGGTYTLTVTDTLCNGSATIVVTEGQVHDLYYEVEACPKAVVTIASPLGNAQSYQWASGETSRSIEVVGPNTYYYDLIDVDGCPHSDSVTVFPIDSMAVMYSPNAFTPDGDGINDYFEIFGFGEIDVEITIWDRWGELLHSATSKGAVWDGRYNGQVVQNGVYVYRLSYDSFCEEGDRQEVFGHVTVIR